MDNQQISVNPAQIQAQMDALATQRNDALNTIVNLTGMNAILQQDKMALQVQINNLTVAVQSLEKEVQAFAAAQLEETVKPAKVAGKRPD